MSSLREREEGECLSVMHIVLSESELIYCSDGVQRLVLCYCIKGAQ